MIWFVDSHDGAARVTVGHRREYFDSKLPDRGMTIIPAMDLGIGLTVHDGTLQVVRQGHIAAQIARSGESLGKALTKGCIEISEAEAAALRAGEPHTFSLVHTGLAPAGTVVLYLGATDEELAERFLAEGIVTDRAQLRGLLSEAEREALRVRLLAASTLPEHQATEVARFEYHERPWWKFWAKRGPRTVLVRPKR